MIGFSKTSTESKATLALLVSLLESIDKRLADLTTQMTRSATVIENFLIIRKKIDQDTEPTEYDEKY